MEHEGWEVVDNISIPEDKREDHNIRKGTETINTSTEAYNENSKSTDTWDVLLTRLSNIKLQLQTCPKALSKHGCEKWQIVLVKYESAFPQTNQELIENDITKIHQILQTAKDIEEYIDSVQSDYRYRTSTCFEEKTKDERKNIEENDECLCNEPTPDLPCDNLQNEINKNEKLSFQIQQLEYQLNEAKKQNDLAKSNMTILEAQKEKLLTRLSEIAGLKVYDNNPVIQDLSDSRRPLKLAEAFGELYDNEWTNALEEMLVEENEEKKNIEKLSKLLQDIYDQCKSLAENQRRKFLTVMTLTDDAESCSHESSLLKQTSWKNVKDFQRSNALSMLEYVKQKFSDGFQCDGMGGEMKQYVNRCAELCWLMNVQDPPLLLLFDVIQGQTIKEDVFSHYTRSGTVVEFLVWPAIVYENGTVFRKGVVQPQRPDK